MSNTSRSCETCLFLPSPKHELPCSECVSHNQWLDKGRVSGVNLTAPIPAGGNKNDKDKLRYDLIPPELLEAVAAILTFGANKYGDRNWEKGISRGRVFGALMRHLWAWWAGEKLDPETGKSHLWHAACNIAFLVTYEKRGIDLE